MKNLIGSLEILMFVVVFFCGGLANNFAKMIKKCNFELLRAEVTRLGFIKSSTESNKISDHGK